MFSSKNSPKRFSKDLDQIQHQAKVKRRLLSLIEKIKEIEGLTELRDVKKIASGVMIRKSDARFQGQLIKSV